MRILLTALICYLFCSSLIAQKFNCGSGEIISITHVSTLLKVNKDRVREINRVKNIINQSVVSDPKDIYIKNFYQYVVSNICDNDIRNEYEQLLVWLKEDLERLRLLRYNLNKIKSSSGFGGSGLHEARSYLNLYENNSIKEIEIPSFPWPPPSPSSRYRMNEFAPTTDSVLLIEKIFKENLVEAGYEQLSYYNIPDDGFAIVTQLERIDDQGKPLELDRFNVSKKQAINSIGDYFKLLIFGDRSRYRCLVFLFTNKDFNTSNSLKFEAFSPIVKGGLLSAHQSQFKKLNSSLLITMFAYEFLNDPGTGEIQLVVDSSISGKQHMAKSKIKIHE